MCPWNDMNKSRTIHLEMGVPGLVGCKIGAPAGRTAKQRPRVQRPPIIGFLIFLIYLMLPSLQAAFGSGIYDPLAEPEGFTPHFVDLTVHDTGRNRDIPLRVYLPAANSPEPVILFSHGLGGSREGSSYLGRHWSARGYVVVYLQHPGSDDSLWKDKPPAQALLAMQRAAGLRNFLGRIKDVAVVLDKLEIWNGTSGHKLAGRMDLGHVGMSGHSFGAVTTQAVSGEIYRRGRLSFTDRRIRAAVIFSPSSPRREDPRTAFRRVEIPWMLMTGTRDTAPIGDVDYASRLAVFPALPPGGKYEVVLAGANHYAFTDRELSGSKEPRNPDHHRVILALSTAFWDTWLRHDPLAKNRLDGNGPRSVLDTDDRWQQK